jgi:DOPA 4,5-dioxygenase
MIRDPDQAITRGFDIHVVFSSVQTIPARALFESFLTFLAERQLPHTRPLLFESAVGPWPGPMWQVLLPPGPRLYEDLGQCVSWLMLNRGDFSVMVHPNTVQEGSQGGAVEDHSQSHFWMGTPLTLRLDVLR